MTCCENKEDCSSALHPLDSEAVNSLFREARTYSYWKPCDVSNEILKEVYEIVKLAPTAANSAPARFVFIKSKEAKERLKPLLSPNNVDKTMSAPVTVAIACDLEFYNYLPKLYPFVDAKSWYDSDEKYAKVTAHLNASLQAAYFIIAARSKGLDCGPMSGFDHEAVAKEFFPDIKSEMILICNVGVGDETKLHPRAPRFEFDEVCKIL